MCGDLNGKFQNELVGIVFMILTILVDFVGSYIYFCVEWVKNKIYFHVCTFISNSTAAIPPFVPSK